MPEDIEKLLKELKQGLVQIYGKRLRGLYLYGSYARGDQHQGSDLDVMILLEDYEDYGDELRRISGLAGDISLEHDITISCIFVKETQWQNSDKPLLDRIRKEGVPA